MGRARLAYGFDKGQAELLCADPLVVQFLGKFKGRSTFHNYSLALCLFFNWLRVRKGLVFSPSQFLDEHMKRRAGASIADRQWALRLVLEFSRDNPDFKALGGGRKYHLFSVVRSFCRCFEADLTTSENPFGKRGGRKFKPRQMSVELARKVLGVLPQRERAICMVMLQSGMGAGDVLSKFNFQRQQVLAALQSRAERLKIELPERKGNGLSYFTYISVDALQKLRKWFVARNAIVASLGQDRHPDVVFIKKNGGVFDLWDFEGNFTYHMRKHKLKDGPWSLSSHMLRKLFKTESRPPERNVDAACVEFMMGHLSGIECVGGIYDRTPELHEGVIEREYEAGEILEHLQLRVDRGVFGCR